MNILHSSDAGNFYRAAVRRTEEAEVLLRAEKTTGAVYLAGYGIECVLKALILSSVPKSRLHKVMKLYRGAKAHDLEWLRSVYIKQSGVTFSRDLTKQFTFVKTWTTDLRYNPKTIPIKDAQKFLAAANEIVFWGKERL